MNLIGTLWPRLAIDRRLEHTDSAERVKPRSLAERIGFSSDDRLLIISCDDLGSSRSTNRAIARALRSGIGSSATLMVPCQWARAAADDCRDLDVGVHLTLTSEFPSYRWSSLTGAASLADGDGYLPRRIEEVWARAELDDVELECRAQIDRALEWGVDVTHLNSHMDVMELDSGYFDVYMRLAESYRLPVRLRRSGLLAPLTSISRRILGRRRIVTTDYFCSPPWGEMSRPTLVKCIERARRGVTEFVLHPAEHSDELFAYDTESADVRATDAECVLDKSLHALISENGIRLIGYRPLRDAMRNEAARPTSGASDARQRIEAPERGYA